MPVKLTSSGKKLEESLKQEAKPAVPAQVAQVPVDALLDNAADIPQQQQQLVAHAEVGTIKKDGVITVETTEHPHVWVTPPHANYQGPFGKVTYGLSATINTGQYENMKPFVQIEVPFIPGQQEQAYAYAEDWVDARITNIITSTKAGISGA